MMMGPVSPLPTLTPSYKPEAAVHMLSDDDGEFAIARSKIETVTVE